MTCITERKDLCKGHKGQVHTYSSRYIHGGVYTRTCEWYVSVEVMQYNTIVEPL